MKSRPAETIKEVLIATKWILENVGWCKRYYWQDASGEEIPSRCLYDRAGNGKRIAKCCLTGAIKLVNVLGYEGLQETSFLHMQTELLVVETINKIYPGRYSLPGFNDNILTQFKDVIALLDAAIKECK